MRVAINGFGRIGRAVFRRALETGMDVVAVNDLIGVDNIVYLLRYDSVYGRWNRSVEAGDGFILVDGKKVMVCSEKNPVKLPWGKLGVDIVIESTGLFRKRSDASKHLKAGAKKVIISATAKDVDYMVVLGVNDDELKKEYKIISMASCTTNCIAPIVKILDDEFGLESGFLTTVHAYTGGQSLIDGSHKDFRRGRAAGVNLVPTTSGAAKATGEVVSNVKGKIDGMAIRAPVVCGSVCDFVGVLKKESSVEEVNDVVKKASRKMKGILEYSEEELVSSDVIGNSVSSVFDSKLTKVNGSIVKVLAWYDNEWGYSCRVVDLIKRLENV